VHSLKGLAEKQKIEFNSSKKESEQQIKVLNLLFENYEKNIREEMSKKHNSLLEKLNFELGDIRNAFHGIKIENGKYHLEAMNMGKALRQDCDNLKIFKVELDIKVGELGKLHEKTNKNFVKLQEEFDLFKLKFNELSEFIKVILLILILFKYYLYINKINYIRM